MLEMITNKMTIDLNVFSLLMKNLVVSDLNKTLVITIHRSRKKNRILILASNQCNQTISLVVDVIA
jgi:archaellum biogenesis ATPase FlaH